MNSFKIGHFTNLKEGTGCTVILCPEGTTASAYARGSAPGTREFALLSPQRKMEDIHALLFTGGSAFGLDAAAGVMRYLAERNIGYKTTFGVIPIVPAAVIYDLYMIDSAVYPNADNAYRACQTAKTDNAEQGNVGAGTGATVGKWAGLRFQMKGGLGIYMVNNLRFWVQALAVVNPVGDVVESDGRIVAGALKEGRFLADKDPEVRWDLSKQTFGENTVLLTVMTNVKLTKHQLHYIADRTHNGIVKAVVPAHTSYDGDIVFAMSSGGDDLALDTVTEMAVEAARCAILNGVKYARQLGNVISIMEL